MKITQIVILFSLVTTACRIDSSEEIEEKDLNFTTTDDSEIFFKNVRQLYYDLEEMPEANLNIYRIKRRTKEASYALIDIAIVWNWLRDEAFILVEPNEILMNKDSFDIYWTNSHSGEEGVIEYRIGNSMEQLQFVTELYNGIIHDYSFELAMAEGRVPFLNLKKDREAIRKTMADYFRLTGTF